MNDAQIMALFISTIIALVGAIVFLYFRNEKVHKRYADLADKNLLTMTNSYRENTEALLKNGTQIESANTINREVEKLLQTVHKDIIELKVKGRRGVKKGATTFAEMAPTMSRPDHVKQKSFRSRFKVNKL